MVSIETMIGLGSLTFCSLMSMTMTTIDIIGVVGIKVNNINKIKETTYIIKKLKHYQTGFFSSKKFGDSRPKSSFNAFFSGI